MARKPAPRPIRTALVVAGWVGAAALVQAVLGAEIGAATRLLEQGIEQRFEGPPPQQARPPARSHEEDAFEPWELVSV
jgi:hypothetical protein